MDLKKFVVAMDFDGVIWDSVDECFVVGFRVYRELGRKIQEEEGSLREKFRSARYLAKTGGDFYILFRLLADNLKTDFNSINPHDFYRRREEYKEEISSFTKKFYEERERFKKEDFQGWLSLQAPHGEVLEQLPVIKEQFRDLVICSTKDKGSIEQLLSLYNQSYRVYGREFSTMKGDQMRRISEDYDVPGDRIIFVDDLLENLLHARDVGVHCLMTSWGYNTCSEREKALFRGIKLIPDKKNIAESLIKSLKEYLQRDFSVL